MSRRPSLRLWDTQAVGRSRRLEALIEDYLDHLCAPLVGIVPFTERGSLRDEVRSHVEALGAEYTYQGKSPELATEAALRELGEPWHVGQTFLREWLQGAPDADPKRLTGATALRAFGFFGVAAVLNWALLEYRALILPTDDLVPWLTLTALLSPLIAGFLTGKTTPPRLSPGLCWAFSVLVAHSFLTGTALLPNGDGLTLAKCMAVWWLPSGWLTAVITAHLVRRHRRQRFLKYVQ